MILEQFLNKKAKEIENPIRNWGVGFTAEVINEWIDLQIQVKKLTIPAVSKSFTAEQVVNELEDCDTLDDAIMFFKEQMQQYMFANSFIRQHLPNENHLINNSLSFESRFSY